MLQQLLQHRVCQHHYWSMQSMSQKSKPKNLKDLTFIEEKREKDLSSFSFLPCFNFTFCLHKKKEKMQFQDLKCFSSSFSKGGDKQIYIKYFLTKSPIGYWTHFSLLLEHNTNCLPLSTWNFIKNLKCIPFHFSFFFFFWLL